MCAQMYAVADHVKMEVLAFLGHQVVVFLMYAYVEMVTQAPTVRRKVYMI